MVWTMKSRMWKLLIKKVQNVKIQKHCVDRWEASWRVNVWYQTNKKGEDHGGFWLVNKKEQYDCTIWISLCWVGCEFVNMLCKSCTRIFLIVILISIGQSRVVFPVQIFHLKNSFAHVWWFMFLWLNYDYFLKYALGWIC